MAIIKEFPGISSAVHVDGKPLKEYIDDAIQDDDGVITRYIEAVSGKNFEIHIDVKGRTKITRSAVACRINVDGFNVINPLIEKKEFIAKNVTNIIVGKELGSSNFQKLGFVVLETVSDGRVLNSEAANMKNLGTIVINVGFVDLKGVSRPSEPSTALKGLGIVSEKALKGEAITHGVNFREAVSTKAQAKVCDAQNRDEKNKFQIVFKYRSTEALKQMCIIPRTPSPEPIERRAPESLSRDEIVKLQQFYLSQDAKKEAAVKIKRERKDDNPRPRKVVRPCAGDTLLSIDDENGVRELSTATLQQDEKEVIELD